MHLDFSKDYRLENEVVLLSPLKQEHFPKLQELATDPEIWTFFLEKGQSTAEFNDYIQNALQQRKAQKEYPLVVFDKIKKQYAGMTRLYAYDAFLGSIKVGHTWYGKAFRGTGINKNCKYLLFEFIFENLQLERIGFGAYASNTISLKAMESVGCTQEGLLRSLFPAIDGKGRTDCALYSILREEWMSSAKSKLSRKLDKKQNK